MNFAKNDRGPSALARFLGLEITKGHYKIGDMLPTEAELQVRFAASRYSVREALKTLKDAGLVVATPGIGTQVRAAEAERRYVHGYGTLQELIQLPDSSLIKLVGRRSFIANESEARELGMQVGQQWVEASVLRFKSDLKKPTCSVLVYVRPEHAEVIDHIDSTRTTLNKLIEESYGVRTAEVRQRIVAVSLNASQATRLLAPRRSAALKVSRYFTDAQGKPLMVSVGVYPHDRYSQDTVFRVSPD